MRLDELLAAAAPLRVAGALDVEIKDLRHDSRHVKPGDLFFAVPGAKTDGNRHAKDAAAKGAVAIVSELEPPPPPASLPATWAQVRDVAEAMGKMADRFFGHPSKALTTIGVTGTKGKTTTTYFLESIVAKAGGKAGVIGTVDYRLGGRQISKAPNTTPISLELLRLLALFRDSGASHGLMEVSSHALALKRVEEVDFDAAIFTNITKDHLDFHKTEEEYFAAKAKLIAQVDRARSGKKRRAVALSASDPRILALGRGLTSTRAVSFGLDEALDYAAVDVAPSAKGTFFHLKPPKGKRVEARIRLVGQFNVLNALGAAAACLELGMPMDKVVAGLEALPSVPGRLEPVDAGQDFTVLVDYAHTEDALLNVLGYLKGVPHARIITVFGCGGDRDRTKRGPMGLAACRNSDLVVITSDNPRSEDPLAILAEIEAPLKTGGLKNYKIEPDRAAAIGQAIAAARKDDIVLIAGKGHEDYQILKDRTIHFDDREAAREALTKNR